MAAKQGNLSRNRPYEGFIVTVFHTAEVRWFGKEDLPATVLSWFHQCPGKALRLEQRIDSYLLTQVDNVGIKIRGDRLEIKFRTRSVGQRQFHRNLAGVIEHWTKVGFDNDMGSISARTLENPVTQWLDVRKARLVRHYILSQSGDIAPLNTNAKSYSPMQLEVQDGCSVEITEIQVPQGKWWSLGFEAFGSDQRREELLIGAINILGRTFSSPPLAFQDSFGYPSWLADL